MTLLRFGTLLAVAALAGCVGEAPDTGTRGIPQSLMDDGLECEVIDFDELVGGTFSGVLDPLTTTVLGVDVDFQITGWTDLSDCGTGQVVIFDTSVPSYYDPDLVEAGQSVTPNLLNVAAHQSCRTPGIPNDADVPGTMRFTFPDGEWYVAGFAALDQEGPGDGESIALRIDVVTDGTTVATTDITTDYADAVEFVDVVPAALFTNTLDFDFTGSGAIDEIEICRPEEEMGEEGCTPGYWKQPHHFDSWPVSTDMGFGDAFDGFCDMYDVDLVRPERGTICDLTLLEALGTRGGGPNALARAAAAAWLNTGAIAYPYSRAQVEMKVEGAMMSGDFEDAAGDLDDANNLGCPLD